MLKNYLLVGIGGAIGAMLRYGLNDFAVLLHRSNQLNTLIVNIVGSFAMGFIVASCKNDDWKLFATVGLCGGFTTFSTFSMQSVTLLQQGRFGMGALYIFGTAIMCVLFAFLGFVVGNRVKYLSH